MGTVVGEVNGAIQTSYKAADQVVTDIITPQSDTHLSAALKTGRKYLFKIIYFCSLNATTSGIKLDLDGGTATATNIIAQYQIQANQATERSDTEATALATDATLATSKNSYFIEINGSIEPAIDGTLIPRFSEVIILTSNETITMKRGSNMIVVEVLD